MILLSIFFSQIRILNSKVKRGSTLRRYSLWCDKVMTSRYQFLAVCGFKPLLHCSLGIVYDGQNVCEEKAAQMVRESEVEELRAASRIQQVESG